MKAIKSIFIVMVALCISPVVLHAQSSKTVKMDTSIHKVYTCTMHPEVISNKPGKCPKCGMDLVEKKSSKQSKDPMQKMPMQKKDSTMPKKKMVS
jgi:Heavy metal binding domain